MIVRASWIAAALLLAHSTVLAQVVSHRGFIQARSVLYPQEAIGDDRQVLVEGLFRYEPTLRVAPWLRAFGGIDLRTDSWDQTDGELQPDFRDRGVLRPTVSIRRLSANINRGGLNLDLGKQFIRWGKTDILVPTDRFAPRDFLEVTNDEFLAVTGARLVYEASRSHVRSDLDPLVHAQPSAPARRTMVSGAGGSRSAVGDVRRGGVSRRLSARRPLEHRDRSLRVLTFDLRRFQSSTDRRA